MSTEISLSGEDLLINGEPTYRGRSWKGKKIEGLLMNSRMVQAIFDDENPETRSRWGYPDTGVWDPERNMREFVESMRSWRDHGLLAFTVNLQGGNPMGYSREQPWHNSAFGADGSLKPENLDRMSSVLDEADGLGMAIIVGYFYFGQDWRLRDDAAVKRAAHAATTWLLGTGHRNILVEIDNECDIRYTRDCLKAPSVHMLMEEVRGIREQGRGFPVSASFSGQRTPTENAIAASDFVLLHGNGPENPARIRRMVDEVRDSPAYRGQPIVFNEDDHFTFDGDENHLLSAMASRASWGYFDPGLSNYVDGYQCPPVNWGINTGRKRSFFEKIREITSDR